MIYISDSLNSSNTSLNDEMITVNNTISLKRKVQMYQWDENIEIEKKR